MKRVYTGIVGFLMFLSGDVAMTQTEITLY